MKQLGQFTKEELLEFAKWIEENTTILSKRQIARKPTLLKESAFVVVTDRNEPVGVYVNFDRALPNLPQPITGFLAFVSLVHLTKTNNLPFDEFVCNILNEQYFNLEQSK